MQPASCKVGDLFHNSRSFKHQSNAKLHHNFKISDKVISSDARANCCYCCKVFSNSRYLVKHILRRHPNQFLDLHNELMSNKNEFRVVESGRTLTMLLEEIQELKKMLRDTKFEIDEYFRYLSFNSKLVDDKVSVISNSRPESKKYELKNQVVIEEFEKLKLNYKKSENSINELEEKIGFIMQSLESNFLKDLCESHCKKVLKDALKLQKKEILSFEKELEQKLGNLQCEIIQQSKEANVERETKIAQFEYECINRMENLVSFVDSKMKKIESCHEADKRIEQKVLHLLNKVRNKSKHQLPRRRKELPSFMHTSVHFNDLSADHDLLSKQKEKIYEAVDTDGYIRRRVVSELKKDPNFLIGAREEILLLLSDKIETLGIPSGKSYLSNVDFKQKIKLIYNENQDLALKYDNYLSLKDYFHHLADKHVHKIHIQNKDKGKKISFSGSQYFSSPVSNKKKNGYGDFMVDKSESYGFLVSTTSTTKARKGENVTRPLPQPNVSEVLEKKDEPKYSSAKQCHMPKHFDSTVNSTESIKEQQDENLLSSVSLKQSSCANKLLIKDDKSKSSLESLSSWNEDDLSTDHID